MGYIASAQVLSDVAREQLGCTINQTQLDEAGATYDAMAAGSVYPETPLVKLATVKLMDSGSPFAVLVQNFEWTNQDQNQVALDIENGMSPEEAAKKWIDAHPDIVARWLEGI